jgi:hypothetical protein
MQVHRVVANVRIDSSSIDQPKRGRSTDLKRADLISNGERLNASDIWNGRKSALNGAERRRKSRKSETERKWSGFKSNGLRNGLVKYRELGTVLLSYTKGQ